MNGADGDPATQPEGAERPADVSTAEPRARCVVVHRRNGSVPRALADALARQRLDHVAMDSPVLALAELCATSRSANRPAILLLDEPSRLESPVTLVRAAKRYAGRAVCWQYRAAAHPQLSAILDRDLDTWAEADAQTDAPVDEAVAEAPQPVAPSRPAATPELRLTPGDPADQRDHDAEAVADAIDPQRLLTSDELSMLFGNGKPNDNGERNA